MKEWENFELMTSIGIHQIDSGAGPTTTDRYQILLAFSFFKKFV
jgi:hypothetical protein